MARTEETRRQRLERLRKAMEDERSSFIDHWKELAEYILPLRERFTITDANRGQRRTQKIIDSTASFSARTLSSGMMAGVTSPARPWFRLTTPDPAFMEVGSVKDWLHVVSERMATVFLRSNLYNKLPVLYRDLGVYGTAAMAVLEDDENIIRCVDFPVGSYAIANDEKLRVRVVARKFRMTVRQLVQQFGGARRNSEPDWSRFSVQTRARWENGDLEQWVDVAHMILPNDEHDPFRIESKHKPFRSVYYEIGGEDERWLEDTGYDEFPLLAPRWETVGEDVYGTSSPGMLALGDIKQLQLGERRAMQAVDKMVNPPMVGPSSLKAVRVSTLPGDITYLPPGATDAALKPAHEVRFDIDKLEAKQQQVRLRIQRAFFEDLFLMLAQSDRRQITAREIQERHEEKLLALGPVLEQLNQDLLDPLIDRTFAIMARRGLIPAPPPELEGMPLKVEYVSIMAQAQKMVGLAGLERFVGFVGQVASVDPMAMDKWDRDQSIDEYAEMTGVAPRVVVPDEEVAAIRQARAEAQRQQAAIEQAATLAPAAKQLSETDMSGDNALTQLLGAGAPGGVL